MSSKTKKKEEKPPELAARKPKAKTGKVLLSHDLFKIIIEQIVHCAADWQETILTGICIEVFEGQIDIVATDGCRLVHFTDKYYDAETELYAIIPAKLFKLLKKCGSFKQLGDIWLECGEGGKVTLSAFNDVTIGGKVIPGEYPLYKELFPTEFEHRIAFNPAYLAEAGKGMGHQVTLQFNEPLKPTVFTGKDSRLKHLLMPVQAR